MYEACVNSKNWDSVILIILISQAPFDGYQSQPFYLVRLNSNIVKSLQSMRGPRKIKFIPAYFCAMYLENIMLPLGPLVPLLYLLHLLPECL